jgi:enterochelin esterase-like enzyme
MIKKLSFAFLLFFAFQIKAQSIKVSSGKIQRFENFKSQFVDSRNIDVWLPDGYSNNEKYAVLYMHDGQALYDAQNTWNKQAWEVDETAGKLIIEGKTQKFIIVGIWNNGQKRHPEYFPQKPYQTLDANQKKFISENLIQKKKIDAEFKVISNDYLMFIVSELKPFIDKTFATKTDRNNTFIAGSSMGGLISLYAICEYPKVFGGAACLSTHWTGIYKNNNNPIPDAFVNYLKKNLPSPKKHKIYFDYGDKTLDSLYQPSQERVNKIMITKGYTEKNWTTEFFPGKDHTENSWRVRFEIPLLFLLKK